MQDSIPQKECPRCKNVYPHTEEYFHKDKSYKSGLKGFCKQCAIKSACAYYDDHRADVLAAKKQHRIDNHDMYVQRDRDRYYSTIEYQRQRGAEYRANNREKRIACMQSWRKRNAERVKAYSRQYHQDHLEECRAKSRKYYRDHLEECLMRSRAWNAKRRLMEKSQGDGYSAADVRLQYKSQKGKCWHCGKDLNGKFHVDHLIPLSKGGKHDASNIVCACPSCNLSKKDKMCFTWNHRLF